LEATVMSTLNTIPFTAAGNLTADPKLRFTGTGQPVAGLRVAVTPRRFDRDTDSYTDGTTTFVDGQVWGEQAEHLAESLHKGDRVLVIGRWVTRILTPTKGPNEGVEQRRLEVVVDEIGPSLAWATAVVTKTGTTVDSVPADPSIVSG
jgi:single-strand DNA-binding protein